MHGTIRFRCASLEQTVLQYGILLYGYDGAKSTSKSTHTKGVIIYNVAFICAKSTSKSTHTKVRRACHSSSVQAKSTSKSTLHQSHRFCVTHAFLLVKSTSKTPPPKGMTKGTIEDIWSKSTSKSTPHLTVHYYATIMQYSSIIVYHTKPFYFVRCE